MTDSHCHLEQLPDPEAAISAFLKAGGTRIVSVGEDEASSRRSLELKKRYPETVLAGIGFHPMFTPERSAEEIDHCLEFLEQEIAGADQLGEVGLDFKYARSEEEQTYQRQVLERQLALAAEARKPINLHSRWALRQTMEVAIDYTRITGLGAQLHWFTQSKKLIRLTNQAGLYVSVGPSLLSCEDSRRVAATIAPELVLLETDSPVPFDGVEARPDWVLQVAEVMAQLWGCELEAVGEKTEANFARFLSRSPVHRQS